MNQSAKTYRIQVDNEPSFQAPLLDNQVVDQTTYTAFDRLYPEGTLYWRVQAMDEEDNGLTWSTTQALPRRAPLWSCRRQPTEVPSQARRHSGGHLRRSRRLHH